MKLVRLVVVLFGGTTGVAYGRSTRSDDRVLLESVKVITLYKDRQTAFRRSPPLPQLVCQSGCDQWTPDAVQCYNMGSDGVDASWKCEASMPEGYSFSFVQVGCEGYGYPEDPYILKDSCQLSYALNIPRGDRQHGGYREARSAWDEGSKGSRSKGGLASRLGTWAALGIVGYILYNVMLFLGGRSSGATPQAGGSRSWGGGGGGGGGGGDPDKGPYAPSAPPEPSTQSDGMFPWLAGGGIGAALAYMLRPRRGVRRTASTARYGGFARGSTSTTGSRAGVGTAYRRSGQGSVGGGETLQAGYGGTTRR